MRTADHARAGGGVAGRDRPAQHGEASGDPVRLGRLVRLPVRHGRRRLHDLGGLPGRRPARARRTGRPGHRGRRRHHHERCDRHAEAPFHGRDRHPHDPLRPDLPGRGGLERAHPGRLRCSPRPARRSRRHHHGPAGLRPSGGRPAHRLPAGRLGPPARRGPQGRRHDVRRSHRPRERHLPYLHHRPERRPRGRLQRPLARRRLEGDTDRLRARHRAQPGRGAGRPARSGRR